MRTSPHPSLSLEGRGSDILYFVGCSTLLDKDILNSTINLLDKAGEGYSTFSDCCGFPLWASGYAEDAKGLADKVKTALSSSGVKR